MALIECPDCYKQISESAIGCPHCGFILTREIVAAQKEAKAQREQEFVETAKREERETIFWIGAITALVVIGIVLRGTFPIANKYEPQWSDSETSAANAPWLDGFTAAEKETILQEAYLFDAAAKELERERDR